LSGKVRESGLAYLKQNKNTYNVDSVSKKIYVLWDMELQFVGTNNPEEEMKCPLRVYNFFFRN
jgi:hypothetical protein